MSIERGVSENLIGRPFEQVIEGGYNNLKLGTVMGEQRVQQLQKLPRSVSHHEGI